MKKHRLICSAVLIGTFAMAGAAHAANWKPGAEVKDKGKVFVDADRFQRQGDTVNSWVRIDYAQTQTIPFLQKQYDQIERLYYFDCKGKRMVVARSDFLKAGKTVHTIDMQAPNQLGKTNWEKQDVQPGTVDEGALESACKLTPEKK